MTGTDCPPGLRVLIVEDSRPAADSLAALVQCRGHQVRVAYDGEAGLAAARRYAPDCVISDIDMPGLNGYHLARTIRADAALARVRLVAWSANPDPDHPRLAADAGFDYLLAKPAELDEVLAVIEKIKELADTTEKLARQNVDLAGQTKDLIQEVKEDLKEVKQDVKELKAEVKELKQDAAQNAGRNAADALGPSSRNGD